MVHLNRKIYKYNDCYHYILFMTYLCLQVRNLGPSSVKSLSVVIHWPSTLEDGQNLLYLPTMPQVVRGQGSCTTDVVNPYNLTVSFQLLLHTNLRLCLM